MQILLAPVSFVYLWPYQLCCHCLIGLLVDKCCPAFLPGTIFIQYLQAEHTFWSPVLATSSNSVKVRPCLVVVPGIALLAWAAALEIGVTDRTQNCSCVSHLRCLPCWLGQTRACTGAFTAILQPMLKPLLRVLTLADADIWL